MRPGRHRKVAILGFGRSVKDCPWRDASWDLWGLNGFWRAAKPDFEIDVPEDRYSLWLDVHTIEFTRQYGIRAGIGDQQERWLEQPHPFTILSVAEDPAWPSVRAFPIEALIARFGRDYFTSSVAYAIALAVSMEDVAEVGLWGIDLIDDTEYSDQRPCAEYWVGRAEALGIKITIHEQSALLKQRARYGYDDISSPLLRELRAGLAEQLKGLGQAIEKSKQAAVDAQAQAHTDAGAFQVTQGLLTRLDKWARGGRI